MDLQPWVDQNREKFEAMVPANVSGGRERFLRNMVFQVGSNPAIRKCDKASIIESCLQATLLQLDIGVLGQAYLVPYGQKCTMIPGYRGLLSLARRSGKLKAVHSELVCKEDHYSRTEANFHHEWDPFAERGEVIGAYVIFEMTDGSRQIETMSRLEIEKIRSRSRAGQSGPWVSDWGEMAKKTVMRRGLKKLDLRVEALEEALQADDEQFEPAEVVVRPRRDAGAALLADALAAPPPEENGHEEAPQEPEEERPVAPRAGSDWNWEEVKATLGQISRKLKIPGWIKITPEREQICLERANREGWTTDADFMQGVHERLWDLPPEYMANWSEGGRTLEALIRIPKRGNPDHFQRVGEWDGKTDLQEMEEREAELKEQIKESVKNTGRYNSTADKELGELQTKIHRMKAKAGGA